MTTLATLRLDYQPAGSNGMAVIRATLDDVPVHVDRVNLSVASARTRFAKHLHKLRADIETATVEAELLRIETELSAARDAIPAPTAELDLTRIARPELFHTPDVSGLAIPAVGFVGGEPAGRWELHLRWHDDGRRERRPLAPSIELCDSARLWLYPIPGEPATNARPGWSADARRNWLDGADAPDPAALFRLTCETIARYIDFAPDSAAGDLATLALWSWLSYIYPAWRAVPYLSVGGPLGSGKSTLFNVIGQLAYRPLQSSNMTAPCLFRTLHELGGVLLLDEAERLRDGTPDAGEIRSILLSGYKAGSPAMRLEKAGDSFKRTSFDVFGLKALACIGQLPEALASRCIRVSMFRAGPDSEKPRRRIDADPEWSEIRDGLHALALEHGATWLELARRGDVCPSALSGRDFELWQPLLALATWLDERGLTGLAGTIQEHALTLSDAGRDDAVPEADELLLRLLARHVEAGTHRGLRASDLLKEAAAQDSVSFVKWTGRGIAAALSRYGLRTRKVTGHKVYSAVTFESLRRIERAYGMSLDLTPENVPQCTPSAPKPTGAVENPASLGYVG